MSELKDKQYAACRLVARLIQMAQYMGFRPRLGEAWRPQEMAETYAERGIGIKDSLHCERLAFDLILDDRDGNYLTKTEDYRALGEWWEHQSTDEYTCMWGGRFGDGNHFSIGHGGRK